MKLRARMANERQSRARQPFVFRLVTSTPAIALAALVVMLAVSLVWLAQRNRGQAPSPPQVASKEGPKAPEETVQVSKGGTTVDTGVTPPPDDVKQGSRSDRGVNSVREINSKSFQPSVKAVDYGLGPAERITQLEQRAGEVSLSAPLKPMVVSMQDDHGATHKISLPPVSFGAQRLVDNHIPVSSTNSRSW